MAVDVGQIARAMPLAREARAIRRIVDKRREVLRGDAATILGGLLALVALAGVILLAALGREIPTVLSGVVGAAVLWFFTTSQGAVNEATSRGTKEGQ